MADYRRPSTGNKLAWTDISLTIRTILKFSVVENLSKLEETFMSDKGMKEKEIYHPTEVLMDNGCPCSLTKKASIANKSQNKNNDQNWPKNFTKQWTSHLSME